MECIRNHKKIHRLFQRLYYELYKRHIFAITAPIRVLPDFIVIGAGRTGTTSLYYYLQEHPSIKKSAYDELGFFGENFHLGLNWYKSLFTTIFTRFFVKLRTGYFMTYDITPQYIRRPWVAEQIKSILPKIKLIAVLRNPVDRTHSHWQLYKKNTQKNDNRTFEEMIKDDIENIQKNSTVSKDNFYFANFVENSFLARSFYAEQLDVWFKLFPKEQILVIKSEDLANNTRKIMNQIFDFLGLPKYDLMHVTKVNTLNYSPMKEETRSFLIDFFKPYNKKLYEFLNKNYDWDK